MPVVVRDFPVPRTGTVLPNAYLRVRQTVVLEDKQRILLLVDVYNSQADRAAGKEPVLTLEHTFGQQVYAALQALIKDRAEQRILALYPGSTQISGD